MPVKYGPDAEPDEAGKWAVTGRVVRETQKALLLEDDVGQEWLPKSKVKVREAKGGLVEVLMPEWLAKEKRYV